MVKKTSKVQVRLAGTEIPKMSEGYYSGDKPNPNLRAFAEAHLKEHPYDPAHDDYDVKAFDKPIDATKATAIYNLHTYWSKKPHDAILQYIRHYTKRSDIVLDPFCGSGGTALAALMEGRKAIAIDRSPAATFITNNYCTPVDIENLNSIFEELESKVNVEIDWLYNTKCDRCGGDATTVYTVYSQVFQCARCMEKIPLSDCIELEKDMGNNKTKHILVCPICHKNGHEEIISTREKRLGSIPVISGYECNNGCKPKRGERKYNDIDVVKKEYFCKYDLSKLNEIEKKSIPYTIPNDSMMHIEDGKPWGVLWRPYHEGIYHVFDFFTKRNLWALLILKETIKQLDYNEPTKLFILGGISAILQKSSKLMGYREDGIGRVMSGTYWIPPMNKDINVWSYFLEWYNDALRHLDEKNNILSQYNHLDLIISTESATNLSNIPSNSCDYIFTDPPYSWKVQYGEANFLWESFLNFDTHWHGEEIIVNEFRGKNEDEWAKLMKKAFSECYRVLKPGRWITLCYHDTSEGTWSIIQDIMAEVGFISDKSESAIYINADQKSIKQITADKSTKRDLVINFYKPKPGQSKLDIYITGDEDKGTFSEKVLTIIKDYLNLYPGSTKDRIYDEVVSRMVRSGHMQPYDFDDFLSQVAESTKPEGNFVKSEHWYIKGSELELEDSTESVKEESAATKLRFFISNFLKNNPSYEGIHYSDLFEQYIFIVKDKPRRPLIDWLPDYFYKTDEGTYRLPASEEEEKLKAESRSKGVNRRIKRYLSYLLQGVAVPEDERPSDITLADWIRNCKRSSMYEQGKLLFEKGGINMDALPEEARINVEEDYNVCVRMIERLSQPEKAKKIKSSQKSIVEDCE